ncbi:hypothetical protein ACGFWF_38840 [Streptomyces sp. NPDC048581]|uniref:hypothetical protein n=1 Tax=Streptomyces sp. NPDC048581 TaxID=3365572 RepID=UPI003723402E
MTTSSAPADCTGHVVNYGSVEHSVLFPGARIGAGARVRRSVVLHDDVSDPEPAKEAHS